MNIHSLFDKDIAVNAILYVTKGVGGVIDMHKLFKTLYFADMRHMSKYGRRVVGDVYIAMQYGPVPSKIDDILKAVRGDSYFSYSADEFRKYFHFVNNYSIKADLEPDMDYLSESDVECLDYAIALCKDKSFSELTALSHGVAWEYAPKDRPISFADMMREVGEEEEYANYIERKIAGVELV